MTDGLTNCSANEDDVGNAQDGPPSHEVGQCACDEPADQGAQRGGGSDQFLSGSHCKPFL